MRARRWLIPLAAAGAVVTSIGASHALDVLGQPRAALARITSIARTHGATIPHEIACERGSPIDCAIASAILREGEPDDLARAAGFSARVSAGFAPLDASGARVIDPPRELGDEEACAIGEPAHCTLAARAAAGRGEAWRAAALYQMACDAGDPFGCERALRARAIAAR